MYAQQSRGWRRTCESFEEEVQDLEQELAEEKALIKHYQALVDEWMGACHRANDRTSAVIHAVTVLIRDNDHGPIRKIMGHEE